LQTLHGQLHKPGDQQRKAVCGKEETAARRIAPTQSVDIRMEQCKFYDGFPNLLEEFLCFKKQKK
jgi:hypothetical protein